jgi:hypothetical protein
MGGGSAPRQGSVSLLHAIPDRGRSQARNRADTPQYRAIVQRVDDTDIQESAMGQFFSSFVLRHHRHESLPGRQT